MAIIHDFLSKIKWKSPTFQRNHLSSQKRILQAGFSAWVGSLQRHLTFRRFWILPGRAFLCNRGFQRNFLLHKKESCLQDSPPAAGRFSDIYLSAAVQSCPVGLFYAIGDSNGISYCMKKRKPYRTFTIRLPHSFWFFLISASLQLYELYKISSYLSVFKHFLTIRQSKIVITISGNVFPRGMSTFIK